MSVPLPPTGKERGLGPGWLGLPRTSGETTTVVAHYHRAEVARMAGWRDRFDQTTNWAITVIAAMLSVSLSAPAAHHSVLLFAMLLVLLLTIEARRYRFFDVYRGRVRQLERYYYAPIFGAEAGEAGAWARDLAADLRQPVFRISFTDAMTRRLRRNYIWIFLILLLAWVLKVVTLMPKPVVRDDGAALDLWTALDNAALGPLSGWLIVSVVAVFYGVMIGLSLRRPRLEVEDGTVHV